MGSMVVEGDVSTIISLAPVHQALMLRDYMWTNLGNTVISGNEHVFILSTPTQSWDKRLILVYHFLKILNTKMTNIQLNCFQTTP